MLEPGVMGPDSGEPGVLEPTALDWDLLEPADGVTVDTPAVARGRRGR